MKCELAKTVFPSSSFLLGLSIKGILWSVSVGLNMSFRSIIGKDLVGLAGDWISLEDLDNMKSELKDAFGPFNVEGVLGGRFSSCVEVFRRRRCKKRSVKKDRSDVSTAMEMITGM